MPLLSRLSLLILIPGLLDPLMSFYRPDISSDIPDLPLKPPLTIMPAGLLNSDMLVSGGLN